MERPKTGKGVLIVIAVALFAVLAYYASTFGGIAVLGIGVALVAYLLYAGGVRVNRWILGG
ncbi:hypothetical protein [Halosimplex pelagicum]|uniref:Uncharacterized protein n=1 Tax=Halosimplex pelagicum TaxID=869886 RepID=A0A7D5PG35_9EURY|nr:hypothetical protein [Halosimplex pelagicum]QLH83399.1 hypothetical protein HZS54_17950 [Halosimplex pelagicum]